jgi:N,N'-diacetyllegionaminate synthase
MIIGNKKVGPKERPFIIAEIAQTHEGSLGNALVFVDIAKECGADAIKFQTHIASEESTLSEPWRIKFSHQDATRYDYWRRMEFTREQWRLIKAHADAIGIVFLSSPFSIKACEWLRDLGMPAWKIASGEVHNSQLLDWIATMGQPVILSSGLSRADESRTALSRLIEQKVDVALLHCTTRYPTPPEEVGLNVLQEFLNEFPTLPVGLSDHSGNITPGVVASFLGASIIEVHLTLNKRMFGPDVSSSLTPEQLTDLVRSSELAWRMRSHPVDKDQQLSALSKEINIFGRSLYTTRPIEVGELIEESAVGFKKPGGGLDYQQRHLIVGKKARRSLESEYRLEVNDVE